MIMTHPDGSHETEVTQEQFLKIWALRGWKPKKVASKRTKKESKK